MRKYFKGLFEKLSTKEKISNLNIDKTASICKYHDHKKFPNAVSKEHCESCNIDICYMCGSNHVTDGCSVKCINMLANFKKS